MSDILSDEELSALEQGPGTDEPAPTSDQPRDEQGKFLPKAADPTPAQPVEGLTPVTQLEAEQPDDKKGGTVPQQALHAEREKRKGIETELKAAREQLQALAELRQRVAAAKPQEVAPVEGADELTQLRQQVQTLTNSQQQTDGYLQEQQIAGAETQQLVSVLNVAEQEFRQAQPDYDDAIQYVVNARAQELALYGMGPAEIQSAIRDEIMDVARNAVSQGKSPAEIGYAIAQARGYRPVQQEQAHAQQPAPTDAAARQVAAIGAAQAQSKSLGQASGGGGGQTINLETIKSMSNDEFDALYSTPEGRKIIDSLG